MFVFVVPFKCRERCADWSLASRLCANTVRSMLGTPSEVRVVLVCHERPDGLPADARLVVESIETPRPQTWEQMMDDKVLKLKTGLILAAGLRPRGLCEPMRTI